MDVKDSMVVVTGGGAGIGAALVDLLVAEGAAGILVSDRDLSAAEQVAARHAGGAARVIARQADMTSGEDIDRLVAFAERTFGHIDILCSNAGIMTTGGVELPAGDWDLAWRINLMAHVHAARAALPLMVRRGRGHFVNIVSAAGMLTAPGAGPYSVTKHAAVGLAEWMAITYGDQGIGVSLVCPGAVQTGMLAASLADGNEGVRRVAATSAVLDAVSVARAIVEGVIADRFLITPHEDTLPNTQRKWNDPDRWIRGMRAFLRTTA
ncbi:SDR family oxidoreductase [Sphingomonas sp. YL-JM2C]